MKNVSVLLLAGGEGTRYQPLSTPEKPKQFLNLTHSEKSLLKQTWERGVLLTDPKNIWIATNEKYVDTVQKELPDANKKQVIGEMQKKNTAPAIALITWHIAKKNPDTILVVLPSDHFIDDNGVFTKTIETAVMAAKECKGIITLGIPPRAASTQYGYIKQGKAVDVAKQLYQVQQFTEKPIRNRAEKFLAEGGYFWNSGMFVFPVGLMKEEIIRCNQPISDALGTLKGENVTQEFLKWFFDIVPSISIDYAVMEKTDRAMVIPTSFYWSDVGSWEGLALLDKEKHLPLSEETRKTMQLLRDQAS